VPHDAGGLHAIIDGQARPMCCPGCRAVAELIAGSGLAGFYRRRTAFSERPAEGRGEDRGESGGQYRIYDDPDMQAAFTRRDEQGHLRGSLLVGGMTCAACSWLIERSLGEMPGVSEARINLQLTRLDIRLDTRRTCLSELFRHLDSLGYRPRPYRESARRDQLREQQRSALRRLAVAGLGMMQVGMFAVALHAGDLQGMLGEYRDLLRWVSLPIAAFVVLYCARPFFESAWRHLRHGALVMDLPVALAIGLAFLASAWATVTGTGEVYFDSVSMFTFFLLLGRFLEERARLRDAAPWLDALDSLPDAVILRSAGEWTSAPGHRVSAGDELLVRAGDTVPVDASITAGRGAVREDSFSGEHRPRSVRPGDRVYAGTINLEDDLELRALGGRRDSRLAALQRSAEAGGTERPAAVRLADRLASWFVAGVLLVAAATALFWLSHAPEQALWITLSVLVVSCPCALALATPAALASAASALRARGVAVHGENALDTLARSERLVLDKTGTLTRGELTISRVVTLDDTPEITVLGVAAAMQRHAHHPVARAFDGVAAARDLGLSEYRPGEGLIAQRGGDEYRLGSEPFCRARAPALPPPPDEPLYWIALCRGDTPLAWIGLQDEPRPEAAAFMRRVAEAGLAAELLTGDSSAQGPRLAAELGITEVRTGQSPEDKMQRVRDLQGSGQVVAMVGDGLNDAPVLSLADTSFAVVGATDLARARADFVIVDGDLHQVLSAWEMARRCRRVIRQNLTWALLYNTCALPLAVAGLVPPWAAAVGMSLSSLLVVGNSLRLNARDQSN